MERKEKERLDPIIVSAEEELLLAGLQTKALWCSKMSTIIALYHEEVSSTCGHVCQREMDILSQLLLSVSFMCTLVVASVIFAQPRSQLRPVRSPVWLEWNLRPEQQL